MSIRESMWSITPQSPPVIRECQILAQENLIRVLILNHKLTVLIGQISKRLVCYQDDSNDAVIKKSNISHSDLSIIFMLTLYCVYKVVRTL